MKLPSPGMQARSRLRESAPQPAQTVRNKRTMADDELLLDELGTERARRELARAFAERGVPGEFEQGLFRFGFAGLVARVEVMANARPTIAHLHMTLSCPALSSAVLDCCSGVGEGPADALRNGVEQWLAGPYWAYHDAFAHDHAPTWLFERSGESWHVFEAPLQAHGCEGDVLERIVAAEPLRMLLSAPELEHLSPLAAHRIRWVYGSAGTAEVFVDEHFDPRLSKRLREFEWPAPVPLLLRHSAVLLVRERAEQRQAQNLSLDGLHDALQHSATLVEAGQEPTVISHLLHGIELNPTHPRIPALCARWSRWAMRSRDAHSARPLDLPLSSALLSAYEEAYDLIQIGAYTTGANPQVDRAIQLLPAVNAFLCQRCGMPTAAEEARNALLQLGQAWQFNVG